MKNYLVFLTVLFTSSTLHVFGQSDNVSLEDLKMPSSPAFILLDVAPSSIERPTTTKAFSTSILNSINENNGIPENYAIDFAPYWFFKHEKLNAINYWGFRKTDSGTKQTPFSQARFGNISFATVKSKIETDTIGTLQSVNNMAFGIRTTLFQLRKSDDIDKLIELNKKHVTRLRQLMDDPTISPADLILLIEKDPELIKNNEKIKSVLNRKPVFAIDLAAAGSWSFNNNDYNSIKVNRTGAWLTINYSNSLNKKDKSIKNDYLNIYATTRIFDDNNSLDENGLLSTSSVFDSGGKIEFELNKLSFSYEYLFRNNLSNDSHNTFRSSGLIKYRASDQLLVTGSFGKNFGDSNNLITQIGINWGLNNENQKVGIN